jgi:hypothetical protein
MANIGFMVKVVASKGSSGPEYNATVESADVDGTGFKPEGIKEAYDAVAKLTSSSGGGLSRGGKSRRNKKSKKGGKSRKAKKSLRRK